MGALAHQVDGAISCGKSDRRTAFAINSGDGRRVTFFSYLQSWPREVGFYLAVLGASLNLETAVARQTQFNFAFLGFHLDGMGWDGRGPELNIPVAVRDLHAVVEAVKVDVLGTSVDFEGSLDTARLKGSHLHIEPASKLLGCQVRARRSIT